MASAQDHAVIENRLRNVALNYALNKDPQRWWKGELAWLRDGDAYHIGIPSAEVAGEAPIDSGCRMSGPLATIAAHQLRKLDHYNARRLANSARWAAWCDVNGFTRPVAVPKSTPIALRYPVLVRQEMKRDLRWAYRSLGVVPGQWFTTCLHPSAEPIASVPNAARAVAECINFPTWYLEDRYQAEESRAGGS